MIAGPPGWGSIHHELFACPPPLPPIRSHQPGTMSPSSEPHVLPPVFGTAGSESQLLDGSLWDSRFKDLPQSGKIAAE